MATAIQEFAANHGLGSYLNMSAEEIANVINSVVADEELRKQYYSQYGIAANDTPSVNPQNTPIQTSEYRFAVEGKPKVEPIFKIYTPTPQKKISTEEKNRRRKAEGRTYIYTPTPQKKISTEEKTDVKSSNKIKTYGGNTFLD